MPGLQATSPLRSGANDAGRVRVSFSLAAAFPGSIVVLTTRQPPGLGLLERRCCISVQLGVSSVTNDLRGMGFGNYGRPLRGLRLVGSKLPKYPPRRLDHRRDYLERTMSWTHSSALSSRILLKSITRANPTTWDGPYSQYNHTLLGLSAVLFTPTNCVEATAGNGILSASC